MERSKMAAARDSLNLRDLARAVGTSKSTVSLVLQGAPTVSEEKRARVRTAMLQRGYVYHRGAANLRRASGTMVGLVVHDLDNPFFAELIVGIERVLAAEEIVPFLATTGDDPARQARVVKAMLENGAAGFVICPALAADRALLCGVEAWRLPVTCVMRRIPGARVSYVGPDNRHGAEQATAHLVAQGHRRIAFLGGSRNATVHRERAEGYATALCTAGLPFDPSLVVESAPNREGGLAALRQALTVKNPPSAALCFNDVVAFGALHGLALHGLRAGRDFAIVGFDDVRDAQYTDPALTTVSVDPEGLGAKAAQILREQMQDPSTAPVEHHGKAQLIVRSSCGALVRWSKNGVHSQAR